MEKYKYLGTYFDFQLTEENQINFIKRKSNWMYIKLYPYLINASADGRRDMWKTMIAPLFNGIIAHMGTENSVARLTKIYDLWRATFKRFMMIPKSTPIDLIYWMIGTDLREIVKINTENALIKWEYRKNRERSLLDGLQKPQSLNPLKGISNDLCSIIKMQYRLCPICIKTPNRSVMNVRHMEVVHNINIISCYEIMNQITNFYLNQLQKKEKDNKYKIRREIFTKMWTDVLKEIKEDLEAKLHNFLV